MKRLMLFLAVCAFAFCAQGQIDYSKEDNWLICRKGSFLSKGEFDVFYVYPTLFASKDKELMDFSDEKLHRKALDFASAQTGIFHQNVRVFAPCVRQLEYNRCLKELASGIGWSEGGMKTGIEDTVAALSYYLNHWNQGRPFVLLGHSQGSLDLYEALRLMPEIDGSKCFVVAYLPGVNNITTAKINRDFSGRTVCASDGPSQVGRIVVWNTQSPNVKKSPFAADGCYGVNPLDWSRSGNLLPASMNLRSDFYKFWVKNPLERMEVKRNVCGARLDTATGAVVVDLPENSDYDGRAAMGAGIFHAIDIFLFAGNIERNASFRVANWRMKRSR